MRDVVRVVVSLVVAATAGTLTALELRKRKGDCSSSSRGSKRTRRGTSPEAEQVSSAPADGDPALQDLQDSTKAQGAEDESQAAAKDAQGVAENPVVEELIGAAEQPNA